MKSDPVYKLFKYRPINKYLIESIVNSTLYFSNREGLNDPFDCQLDLRNCWERATKQATGRAKTWLQSGLDDAGFISELSEKLGGFGVCSFSLSMAAKSPSTSLLWSHYADDHKGICLLYHFRESFLNDPKNDLFGVAKAQYLVNPLSRWLQNNAPAEMNKLLTELPKIYLTSKSLAWKYEKEARIVRSAPGIFTFPPQHLVQICFGLRTSQEDIELITKLAKQHSNCKNFGKVTRSTSGDFGIDFVKL